MAAHGDGASAVRNRLLAALPPEEYQPLLPDLEPFPLDFQYVLYEPGAPITHVYFPINCVVSLLTVMQDGTALEAATVGNEGMVGLPLFLGVVTAPDRAFCQIPGDAMRMTATAFRAAVTREGTLSRLLRRYAHVLFNQVAQGAACNRLHPVQQRCARWLLLTHDRVGAGHFPLKQEFLAAMLSVQRPTVTQVAGMLREDGCIKYSRGNLSIVDRRALEAAA